MSDATDSSKYEEIIIESSTDKNRTIDLRLGVQSIEYYEDVFSPTITASCSNNPIWSKENSNSLLA